MERVFLRPDDLGGLVAQEFGAARRAEALDRLPGGTKKGVYRLRLDDRTTVIRRLRGGPVRCRAGRLAVDQPV